MDFHRERSGKKNWVLVAVFAVPFMLAQDKNGEKGVDYDEFRVSRLSCVIGNNNGLGVHRAWYNGVFSMRSPDQRETPYVPVYAGINLENFFDARPRHPDREVFFEPRANPMEFKKLNATTAELRQEATPYFGIESTVRFELKDPYYIDMVYTCVPRKDDLAGGFFGVFWASYINGPEDKSIYFLGSESGLEQPFWEQYGTHKHNRDSTVRHEEDDFDPPFEPGPKVLWNQTSLLRYSVPFYYGRIRNMVLIYIFKPNPGIRFSHSPSGGGRNKGNTQTNPAWDFQYVVPNYRVGEPYGFQMRVIYKPWRDRADVLNEVKIYLHGVEFVNQGE